MFYDTYTDIFNKYNFRFSNEYWNHQNITSDVEQFKIFSTIINYNFLKTCSLKKINYNLKGKSLLLWITKVIVNLLQIFKSPLAIISIISSFRFANSQTAFLGIKIVAL